MTLERLFKGLSLIDVLQLYHTKGASGTFKVKDKNCNELGWITMKSGEIINCGLGEIANQKALTELCRRESLDFEYLDKMMLPQQVMTKKFMHLLLEVTSQLDENLLA